MRLPGRGRMPRTKTIRPAEPYLALGADEARRRGHNYIGTEHLLQILVRDPEGGATDLLARLSISTDAVERALACWLGDTAPTTKIDPDALATLGIDFDAVRERLEQTFGPGALEQTRSGPLTFSTANGAASSTVSTTPTTSSNAGRPSFRSGATQPEATKSSCVRTSIRVATTSMLLLSSETNRWRRDEHKEPMAPESDRAGRLPAA